MCALYTKKIRASLYLLRITYCILKYSTYILIFLIIHQLLK